jgi:Na+/H+ antiporter NhaD/arsenite permease-like protein
MLYTPVLQAHQNAHHLWLQLAMASTLAGNLTIIGSIANLIVLEVARDQAEISFWEYFKVGLPLTLLTISIGVLLLQQN